MFAVLSTANIKELYLCVLCVFAVKIKILEREKYAGLNR
jgi:hypothetical protein